MGYDKQRSAHTVRALTRDELGRVLEAGRAFTHPTYFPGIRADRVIEFLYLTGAHPTVLARPDRYNLRSELQAGVLHVFWTRPKKRNLTGQQDLPVVTEDHPAARWIPAFILGLHKQTYTAGHWARLLRMVGKLAGVPLSARMLRHTCGIRIADKSRDPARVQWWLNCSPRVAMAYCRIVSSSDPRVLLLAEGAAPDPRYAPGGPSI